MRDALPDTGPRGWYAIPTWVKWVVGIWLVFSFDAVRMAWGERRFVGGYFEALVADFIFVGIPLLAFGFGIWAGVKTHERTKSTIAGWAVGIAAAFAIYFVRIGA